MKRLLLDQGLPRSSAGLLRRSGSDVTHVSDIGMSRASDIEILARAGSELRVCVTLDADFHALLATSGEKGPSVIRVRREGLDARAFAAMIEAVWPGLEAALEAGAMVTLTDRSIRTRKLPVEIGRASCRERG